MAAPQRAGEKGREEGERGRGEKERKRKEKKEVGKEEKKKRKKEKRKWRKEKKNGKEEKVKMERESERAPAAIAAPVGHAQRPRARAERGPQRNGSGVGNQVFGTEKRFRELGFRVLGRF